MNTPHSSPFAIETRGLSKRYGGRVAVDCVDLVVPRGTAFGYLGPNGAGKTTLIRMLLGLTTASAGTMRILGFDVPADRAAALRGVGAIVEEPRFHGHLSGRRNLEVYAAVVGPDATARIDSVAERIGLRTRLDERVAGYSLGMRQRLGVARCLLTDPQLLLLDEPLNGLDPAGILEFRGMVRDLVAEGRTVVISSHLLDEVEKTCDHVAIVDRGRVVRQGSIAELTAESERRVVIGAGDAAVAAAALGNDPAVRSVTLLNARTLRVVVGNDVDIPRLNRELVQAGVAVHRLEPQHASLEERFLAVTSTLQSEA